MATPEAEVLAQTVRDWAASVGIPGTAPILAAAARAARDFDAGATVEEACESARGLLRSWLHHPSNRTQAA